MAVESTLALIIGPSIVFGIIIGLYELFLIHADENFRGSHWLSHGIHAALIAIVAVFATMNVDYVLSFFPTLPPLLANALLIRIIIGLIFAIKVYTVSAVVQGARGAGMHEKFYHILIAAALVVIVPYIYPFVEPLFPEFLR